MRIPGKKADMDFIKSLNPDIIVNATGSLPLLPPIAGLKEHVDRAGGKVASIVKMINDLPTYPKDLTGKKVCVIGGGAVGLDVVEYFAPKGADVSIVEMLPAIGNGLDPITKVGTAALMKKYNVHQRPGTALQEVKADAFTVKNPDGSIEDIPFDYGFICLGMSANNPILEKLKATFDDGNVEIYVIGDSKRARRIIEGTDEGRNIVKVLEKRGFLD